MIFFPFSIQWELCLIKLFITVLILFFTNKSFYWLFWSIFVKIILTKKISQTSSNLNKIKRGNGLVNLGNSVQIFINYVELRDFKENFFSLFHTFLVWKNHYHLKILKLFNLIYKTLKVLKGNKVLSKILWDNSQRIIKNRVFLT